MTIHHKLAITGIATIILGLVGLTPFAVSWVQTEQPVQHTSTSSTTPSQTKIEPQQSAPVQPAVISGKPVRIEVPAAGIDLIVIDGHYNYQTGEWTLTDTNAQFALPSTQANNQSGNTLIYGHDTAQIFHALHGLAAGAQAIVHTDNGHILTYTLQSSEVVDPSNTSIFTYAGKPRLTLQTCTGVYSEARKFFYFDLVSAK